MAPATVISGLRSRWWPMLRIRMLTSLFVLASLAVPMLHAQDQLTSCPDGWHLSPGEDPVLAQHVPGELRLWVDWRTHSNRYVIAASRHRGAVWITMIDDFQPYWDPDLLPSGDRKVAIERAPKPHTNVHQEQISEVLAQALSLAWSEWLREPPGQRGLGKDGVTYRFRKIDQCGEIWSPDPGTLNDMRVTLVEMLSQLAQGRNGYPPVNLEPRIEAWL